MKTPDITPMQIRATILWVVSFLALVGLDVSTDTSEHLISLAVGFSTALPVILILADAVIRKARAQNIDAIVASQATPEIGAVSSTPPASYVNEGP